jgi:protein-S-isoprenylcysteine O-methyltransferase Ste14
VSLSLALDVVAVAAYATLLLELTVFPIPSEASTWQLLAPETDSQGTELDRAQRRSRAGKLLGYALPTVVGVVALPAAARGDPGAGVAGSRATLCWSTHPAAMLGGMAAIVGGRLLTFGSVLQLRATRQRGGGPPGGLFRWSRNPGLVGMYLGYVGLTVGYSMPLLALVLPLYLWNMHRRVRLEESQLQHTLGSAWASYATHVPRYLPFPGLR